MYEYQADETPSEAVVFAVADVTDHSPLVMDPLNETINAAALDQLLGTTGGSDSTPIVTFIYYGQHVTVTPDEIHIAHHD